MALLGVVAVDKVGWAGNAESLLGIIVSAGWAGEALAILEEGPVIRAILTDSSFGVPDLVISTSNTFNSIIIGISRWAMTFATFFAIYQVFWAADALAIDCIIMGSSWTCQTSSILE